MWTLQQCIQNATTVKSQTISYPTRSALPTLLSFSKLEANLPRINEVSNMVLVQNPVHDR